LKKIGFELRSDLTWDQFTGYVATKFDPKVHPRRPFLVYNLKIGSIVVTDNLIWASSSASKPLEAEYIFAKNI
jgi:hypothetical protein